MKKDKNTVNQISEENDDNLFNIIKLSSEYDKATFFGKLIYLWQWRFFFRNYKNENIKLKDIPKGRSIDGADYIYNEFLKYWEVDIIRARKNNKKPNLIYPIFRQYGLTIIFFGIFSFINFFATLQQAIFVDDLIQNFNKLNDGDAEAKQNIIFYSLIMIALTFIATNASNVNQYFLILISLRVRVCLSELIYRKSLKLNKNALQKTSTGQIVNFLSVDMTRIDEFFYMLPFPVVGLSLLAYAVFRLWTYLSHYTLYGILFLIIILPVQSIIGAIFSTMRLAAAEHTDERIRLVDEFINAIKIIKIYCWEHPFAKKVEEARRKEIAIIRKSLYIYAFSIGLFTSSTKVLVFIVLVSYYFGGGVISDNVVFLTLSVFNAVTFLVTILIPHFILTSSNFWISCKRINKFLTLEEKTSLDDDNNSDIKNLATKEYDLSIKNMTACFNVIKSVENPTYLDDKSSNSSKSTNSVKLFNVLKNINFDCNQGELVIVVGSVGSGKSSLFQAILSELQIREGSIDVNGRLSYAPQEPWVFGGTIRENILFDSEFDQEKYENVIKVCALERDLTLFADGDETFIGERGIVLSGGQKARVSLARALYYDADIYLLDDPLSAVDSNVAKHLFKNAISDYLKFKTAILITHQLNYIKYANKVLFIQNGEQVLFDNSENCLKKLVSEPTSDFTVFIGNSASTQDRQRKPRARESSRQLSASLVSTSLISIPQNLLEKSISLENLEPIVYDEKDEQDQLEEIKKMEKEKRLQEEDDKVSFVYKAYLSYFRYGNILLFGPLLIFGFGGAQFFATLTDYFLKLWADYVKDPENLNSTAITLNLTTTNLNSTLKSKDNDFLKELISENVAYFYTALISCFFFFCLARVIIHAIFSMRVSVSIHKNLFERIVRAKMKFFYENPVGILLNRFSRDIGIVDDELWASFYDFIEITFNDIVIFCVMIFSNLFLILPVSIFLALVIAYRIFYIRTARSLETLQGVAKSPVVQHLTSTLNGLTTVRAFKREKTFIKKFNRCQNDHTSIHFALLSCKRWFGYVLDNLQIIFVGCSLLILILFADSFSGSLAGFILNYILLFSCEFQWAIIGWSNTETYLCSVDRIDRVGINENNADQNLILEPPLESSEDKKPPPNWPQKGVIEFKNVTMRYYQNEAPVLKNLNFKIEDDAKIGIVGRTGAGKSSILAALFRLTDYEGEVLIDGINCKEIGLHDLRGRISIIPQESVLFTGTVRSNLDPLDQYKDHQLWNSLKAVQLEQVVKELQGGLDSKVIDKGSNFSVGQKQLICLARAILKENRILVLDEATANTDPQTDELIQTTIRSVFKHCTILTIAHRLNTIMDSSKILVMDAGKIEEFDTPYRLLQDNTSLFSLMVDAYGEDQAKNLRKIAEESKLKT